MLAGSLPQAIAIPTIESSVPEATQAYSPDIEQGGTIVVDAFIFTEIPNDLPAVELQQEPNPVDASCHYFEFILQLMNACRDRSAVTLNQCRNATIVSGEVCTDGVAQYYRSNENLFNCLAVIILLGTSVGVLGAINVAPAVTGAVMLKDNLRETAEASAVGAPFFYIFLLLTHGCAISRYDGSGNWDSKSVFAYIVMLMVPCSAAANAVGNSILASADPLNHQSSSAHIAAASALGMFAIGAAGVAISTCVPEDKMPCNWRRY